MKSMNYKMVRYVLAKVLLLEAALMSLPLLCALIYKSESTGAFLSTIFFTTFFAFVFSVRQPKDTMIQAKEGFVIVAASWIIMSIFGCMPFVFSGAIPNPVNAFFETVSGFTTTGASILSNVEALDHALLFWRSFTHWIGGMGVLVFILAILPLSKKNNMYLMRAESPGPSVGKLVPSMKKTATILYAIYFVMTVIEILVLYFFCDMPMFDSILHSFGTAGTGGFGIKNSSIGYYDSAAVDYVIGTFMLLFGINFNAFFFIMIGKIKDAFAIEEVRAYLGIVIVSVILIAWNILPQYSSFLEAVRYAYFQVASIITTTGYATTDFDLWPSFSKTIIVLLMFCGACAGSTGGGIKVSRIMILVKYQLSEIKRMVNPRRVHVLKSEGKVVDSDVLSGVQGFFAAYMFILLGCTLLISLDGFDFTTNFTAVLSCISNIGPGLGMVGPTCNFSIYSDLSTLLMSFVMLAGRLELFPMLILFNPALYKKGN